MIRQIQNFIVLSLLMVLVGLLRRCLHFLLGGVCFVWVYSLIWCRRGPFETLMMLTVRIGRVVLLFLSLDCILRVLWLLYFSR